MPHPKNHMQNNTIAMAVLASEQIMPNLEGLLSIHSKETPVSHLFIYHTNDLERSAKPAHRIKKMAENFFGTLKVTLHQPEKNEDGKHPELVYSAIEQWFASVPPSHLVINATGGLKTMFAGVLSFVNAENRQVIYRDLDGTWLQLFMQAGSLQTETIAVDQQKLNQRIKKLGIKELVKIQSGFSEIHSTKPRAITCIAMLEQVIAKQWNWQAVATEKESSGSMFEQWFASLIATFNVDDLVVGLEPHDKLRGPQMETDIWVLKNSQLYTFDLKLISKKQKKSSLAEQITNASAQADKFAGINVKTILVRPGYSFPQENANSLKMLAKRFSCDIWFQEDMPDMLFHLKKLFGQPSSEHEAIMQQLSEAKQQYGYLISNPDFLLSMFSAQNKQKIISLAGLFSKLDSSDYKWLGIQLATSEYIFHIAEQDERKIDYWIVQLNKNSCQSKKISDQQFMVKPINDRGLRYFGKNRSKFTTASLFKM